jgi:hypothetical protein
MTVRAGLGITRFRESDASVVCATFRGLRVVRVGASPTRGAAAIGDGAWGYEEEGVLQIPSRDSPFATSTGTR